MAQDELASICLGLRSERKEVRISALERLHLLLREKEVDASPLPSLSQVVSSPDTVERRMGTWAMGKMAQNKVRSSYPLRLIISLLADEDEEVRENAAWTLGELTSMGVGEEAAIPPLNDLLADAMPQVRGMAAWTLGRMAERLRMGDASSIACLRVLLEDKSLNARKSAIYALERLTAIGVRESTSSP